MQPASEKKNVDSELSSDVKDYNQKSHRYNSASQMYETARFINEGKLDDLIKSAKASVSKIIN